jgi:hypothetical protein
MRRGLQVRTIQLTKVMVLCTQLSSLTHFVDLWMEDSITDSSGVVKWEYFLTRDFQEYAICLLSVCCTIYQVPLGTHGDLGIVLKQPRHCWTHFGHTRAGVR